MTLNIKRSITKFIWHHLKQRAFICIFAVLSIFYYELLVLSILDVFSLFYSSCRFNLTVTKIQQLHHCGHVPLPHPTTTAPSLAKKWEKKRDKTRVKHIYGERTHDREQGLGCWCESGATAADWGGCIETGDEKGGGEVGWGGPICCSDRGACRTRESYWQLIGLRNWHSLKQHLNKCCLNFWRLMLYVSQLSFTDCIILVFTQFVGNT